MYLADLAEPCSLPTKGRIISQTNGEQAMKTYGATRNHNDDGSNGSGKTWTGRQSRKVARRRADDKKILHRRARRTAVIPSIKD